MTDFINTQTAIHGVQIAQLRAYGDERGRFMETFRRDWFPQVSWERLQTNRSDSRAGVLRGLHYHFHQVDYWVVTRGRIRAAMVDLRVQSPSFKQVMTLDMGEENLLGLFIPIGVAHGFAALTDCTLTYTVNNYYDSTDEFGVAWDDATFGIDWGVADPIISERDQQNPTFDNIAPGAMPKPLRV